MDRKKQQNPRECTENPNENFTINTNENSPIKPIEYILSQLMKDLQIYNTKVLEYYCKPEKKVELLNDQNAYLHTNMQNIKDYL